MKTLLLFTTLALLPVSGFCIDTETRIFTNTEGAQIQASVVSATDKEVVLRKDNRNFTIPINTLSPEDQLYIAKVREELADSFEPTLEVKFQSGKSTIRRPYYSSKEVKISPEASIRSKEVAFKVDGAKATVLMFGKSVKYKDYYRVLSKQEFELTLEPGEEKEWKGEPFLTSFYEYDDYGYGHEFDGYVFLLQSSSGNLIHCSGTTKFEKFKGMLLDLKEGADVDQYMKPSKLDLSF